jgi:hypothetical protein
MWNNVMRETQQSCVVEKKRKAAAAQAAPLRSTNFIARFISTAILPKNRD